MTTEQENPVLRALGERHSTPVLDQRTPPRDVISEIVRAGGWAPNHHKTQPWRFFVLAGDARRALGDVFAHSLRAALPVLDEESERLVERERAKPLRAPVLVIAAAVISDHPKVVEIEEVEAVAAAVENMLIAAQALGLGAMWRTGKPAYDPAVKRFLRLPETAHIVAFLYLGYAGELPDRGARRHDAETVWMGWNDETQARQTDLAAEETAQRTL